MTATELLRLLVNRLESAGIPYALGGSVASMVYGEPRATLVIDVVVTLDPSATERLMEAFPAPDFYLSSERVSTVAAEGGTFNAIHPESGLKIDFFVASDRIERSQLARRLRRSVLRISPEAIDQDRVAELVQECGIEVEWARVQED